MTSDLPSNRLIPILVLILTGAIDVVAQNTAERRSKEDVVQLAALIVSAEGTPAADNNLADAYKDERTLKPDGTSIRKVERTGRAWFAGARYTF